MAPHKQLKLVEVEVSSLSKEGYGIACTTNPEGKTSTVEIPFTLPGDKVRAFLLRKEKGVFQGRLDEIITPAPNRVPPVCIHFASCGGCRWQNLSYEDQLELKQKSVIKSFLPHLNDQVIVHQIIPSLPPLQYRNKMEFSFSSNLAGDRYLGLILLGSKGRVFNLQECHLVNPWFADVVKTVRSWWEQSKIDAYHMGKNVGSLRTLIVREGIRTGDRLVMLTVSGNPDFALTRHQLDSFKEAVRHAIEPKDPNGKLSIFLRIQQILKGTPTQFFEMVLYGPDHIREVLHIQEKLDEPSYDLTFKISPSAFFQPNTKQAERLYSRAFQMLEIPPQAIVYDLYCGTGTLGICAARRAKEVIGIELNPESVVDARENVKLNGLENINIIEGDVGKTLGQLIAWGNKRPDVVMVDPPRVGLDAKAIQHLLELKAPKLLYISCNPASQAVNLEELIRGGYQLLEVQPVDQFPQTVHVENIAVLKYIE
ncbi:MAG: 23S rRNA (uracil(1939)-C(5))-methyltransferase RlmD [Parachlamydiaceae bacterium]|nr:23S rRNA (uracil(1939)-C(5))-methyltransferase RlmD [Parachlamydiaceae bacterium]